MPNENQKVIIDTNLWVRYLIYQGKSKIDTLLSDKKITLLFSHALLEELHRVIRRDKFRKYFTMDAANELLLKLQSIANFVITGTEVNICRDAKDNFLLTLARDGNADFLVTDDDDLIILNPFNNTRIVRMNEFLTLIP